MNTNGRFRNKNVNFTQVSNNILRQQSGLTLKARGLFGLIQSYITIPNFTLYKATLRKECIEGKTSFEGAWKELKEKGFLLQYRLQDSKGCFYYEYELLNEPNVEVVEQQKAAIENKQKEEIIHTPKTEVMDKSDNGKQGIYTNINPINTDFNNTYSNNKKNDKKKSNKGYKSIIENYTDNETLRETIYAFIEMRKANHSIITDKGLEKLLIKLDKFTQDVLVKIDILNNSIIKSYRDIFPLQEVIVPQKNNTTPRDNYTQNQTSNLKFNNFESREYDYDNLEKKLLGWSEE